MQGVISKNQIDKLGDRLRSEASVDEDLVMLDEYRRSFNEAYEAIVAIFTGVLRLPTTGRPAKSTQSIQDKLRRESIRLSQIQDIAGCRTVVMNTEEQEEALSMFMRAAHSKGIETTILDRRLHPSYGYRAVHVICFVHGRWVEVQIRTDLQHVWAQLSEKLSDKFDPTIKYGGGGERVQNELERISNHIAEVEADEKEVWMSRQTAREQGREETPEQIQGAYEVDQRREETREALRQMMFAILKLTGDVIV